MVELKPDDYDPLTYGGDATIMRTPWLWRFSGSDLISLVSGLGILVCFFMPWVTFHEMGTRLSFSGLDFANQVDQLRMGVILMIPSTGAILAIRGFSYGMLRVKGVQAWPHPAVSMVLGAVALGFWYWGGSEVSRMLLRNHGVHMLFNAEIGYYATMFFSGMALASAITEAIEHMVWKRAVRKGVGDRAAKFGMVVMPDTVLSDGVAKAMGMASPAAAGAGMAMGGGPDFGGGAAAAPAPGPANWGAGGGGGGGAPAGGGYDAGGGYPQDQYGQQAQGQGWGGDQGGQGYGQDQYYQQQPGGYDQGYGGGGGWQQPPMDPKQRKAWEKQMKKMQKEQAKKKGKGGTPDFGYGGAPPPQF
jgi:hypothetical protein